MAMEPYRQTTPIELPAYLRRRWKRETAAVLLEEHRNAVVKELRLAHAYKMQFRVIDMHVAIGEQITNQIAATNNPLIREVLLRSYDGWTRRAEELLR
jgi:hypothetical protein